jgi:hypothetical protein
MAKAQTKKNSKKPRKPDQSTMAKMTGVGITESRQRGCFKLTLKFDADTFFKAYLRHEQGQADVVARLRKLARQIEELRSEGAQARPGKDAATRGAAN